jgi:hypothetical protein
MGRGGRKGPQRTRRFLRCQFLWFCSISAIEIRGRGGCQGLKSRHCEVAKRPWQSRHRNNASTPEIATSASSLLAMTSFGFKVSKRCRKSLRTNPQDALCDLCASPRSLRLNPGRGGRKGPQRARSLDCQEAWINRRMAAVALSIESISIEALHSLRPLRFSARSAS